MKLISSQVAWTLLRITLGWIMIWAFFDKVFGWGFATASNKSWLGGVSPTFGFLKSASYGPLSPIYHNLAGNILVDWLFMLGLLLIGASLILGIGVKIAGYSGALMMLLMWTALLPPKNNPIVDEHIVYLIIFIGLTTVKSGQYWGFGKWWANTTLVKTYKFLE